MNLILKVLNLKIIPLLSAMLPLPNCVGPDTPRIILGISGGYDVNENTIEEIMKAFMLVGDIMMEEDDQMVVAGQINILGSF